MVDLSKYDNSWYHPGSTLRRMMWYAVDGLLVSCHWMPVSRVKLAVLRAFGANIGRGVVVKPGVRIKYPWLLSVGDYSWIGEDVWIDNLAQVEIGPNCCLSQGAMLLCGNHDYRSERFDLKVGEIHLEEGAWIGARATVVGGVRVGREAILAVGSVATADLRPEGIYQGNPAQWKRERYKTLKG